MCMTHTSLNFFSAFSFLSPAFLSGCHLLQKQICISTQQPPKGVSLLGMLLYWELIFMSGGTGSTYSAAFRYAFLMTFSSASGGTPSAS